MKKILVLLAMLVSLIACGSSERMITDGSTFGDGATGYPKNLSWANIDTDGDGVKENYITPIRYQPCSDCYIYGAVGLLEIQYKIDHKFVASLDLSEQNIHNCLKVTCKATGDDRPILDYLRDYGVIEERYSKMGDWGKCKNCNGYITTEHGYTPVSDVMFFRLKEWRHVITSGMSYTDRKKALVAALQHGPVSITVGGWKGFKADGDTRYCTEYKASGHVAIAVGYINHGEAFLVKNSHGEPGLIKMVFANGDKCHFASIAVQITPGTTYTSWGSGENYCYSTKDTDGDLIPDIHDNCPWDKNVDQKDTDGYTYGDACDKCPKQKGPKGYGCPDKVALIWFPYFIVMK